MVGGVESILGRAIEPVVHRFSTGMPARFTVVEDNIVMTGVVVSFDPDTGKAVAIERIRREHDGQRGRLS
jgi:calcineurin-like phosphoesterase